MLRRSLLILPLLLALIPGAGAEAPASPWTALYARGVLIRDVGIAHSLRVTAGTEEESTAFLDALASLGPGGAARR